MNDNQSICDDDLIFDQVDLCERDETNELLGKIQGLSEDPKLLEVITQLVNIVVKQSKEIKNLKADQSEFEKRIIQNQNEIYDVSERVVDLEKYSRKLCLTFSNIDITADTMGDILQIMSNIMSINIPRHNIAACHPLKPGTNAPVIVKFIYHADRDVVWRRRSWLKNFHNNKGQPMFIKDCLSPRDRAIRSEAIANCIPYYTHKQDVYANNPNNPHPNPVKVKTKAELHAVTGTLTETRKPKKSNHLNWADVIETPKLSTSNDEAKANNPMRRSVKKRKINLSPLEEKEETQSIASEIVNAIVPHILAALKPTTPAVKYNVLPTPGTTSEGAFRVEQSSGT